MRGRAYKILAGAAALVAFYTIVGFLLFPVIIRKVAARELTKALGRTVTIRAVRFNPYVLSVAVHGFRINEKDGGEFLTWGTFYANFELWSSLFHRIWVFKEGALLEPHVNVVRYPDNSLNFADLLLLDWPTIPDFRLSLMRLEGGGVVFHDAALPSKFSTTLGPFTGSFKNFSMKPDHQNRYSFSAVSEAGEKFSWKGSFRLDPLSSQGVLSAENIRIRKYYPYIEEFLKFSITDGSLTARAAYDLDLGRGRFKAILKDGTISARALKVNEHASDRAFFGLSEFTVGGARVDLVNQTIRIASVAVTGGTVVVRRLPDHTFNVENAFRVVTPGSDSKKPTPPAHWKVSVGDVRFADFGAEVSQIFGRQAVSWKELRLSEPTFEMSPMELSIAAVTLKDGTLLFTDPGVTPPVRMALTRLDVETGGLSLGSPKGAGVAVRARINDVARFQISGESNPIHKRGKTNVRGLLQNADLVGLNPYAEKYLGYRLKTGELTLDVKYVFDRRKLHATNRIEIDHLTLGERVESKDATKLPVHLAVALLKDSNGKITLDVPVEGTLDDPAFDVKRAVMQAVFKPFTDTGNAPFAALGSTFGGGGEELGFQEFSAGSASLEPKEIPKLDKIRLGLRRWPELLLDIEGSVNTEKDRGDPQRLAADRAKAVRAYLLRGGTVEPGRIFLIDNSPESTPRKGSRALLHLK